MALVWRNSISLHSASGQLRSLVRPLASVASKPHPIIPKPSQNVGTTNIDTSDIGSTFAPHLTRDHIRSLLYDKDAGYFSTTDCVMTPPAGNEGLSFKMMFGNPGYQRHLRELYKGSDDAWLTPVELFQPWYARGIAGFMAQQAEVTSGKPVSIVEVGGGNGTAARGMLDFIKEQHPEVYERTRYTLVEISGAMASRQHALLSEAHSTDRFEVINEDFLEWTPSSEISESTGFLVALEVLDNLPHDKLVRRVDEQRVESESDWAEWTDATEKEWTETWVVPGVMNEPIEKQRPLQDSIAIRTARWFLTPNIESTVNTTTSGGGGILGYFRRKRQARASIKVLAERTTFEENQTSERAVFVPSGSTSLLDKLVQSLPGHRLIASDFSALPAPDLPESMEGTYNQKWDIRGKAPGLLEGCRNIPLVSRRSEDGKSKDFDTYLVPTGSCDIFFQTDFGAFKKAHNEIVGRDAEVRTPRDFLSEYAEFRNTRTLTGYNPMLEDFSNTRFIIGASSL